MGSPLEVTIDGYHSVADGILAYIDADMDVNSPQVHYAISFWNPLRRFLQLPVPPPLRAL